MWREVSLGSHRKELQQEGGRGTEAGGVGHWNPGSQNLGQGEEAGELKGTTIPRPLTL